MSELSYQLREVKPFSFIYEIKNALPVSACEDMIKRFEQNTGQQYQGRIGQKQNIEQDIKRSTDLRISGRQDWKDVDNGLFLSISTALDKLSTIHPFFASNSFSDSGYNMQRTDVGEFYQWHTDSGPGEFSQRQLVAIWYLNDVPTPGGETEFHFQGVKIVPETGKLILFPPFWTHIHRGVAMREERKYIATTWVCFKQ
ncbi:MAG: 2OG-Fe(II) oxygenase [Arenicellales bacterium]|nr:2OG-Fe(II) oxygenase [Arenicellales bacterium]